MNGAGDSMISKIQALLAKAESTAFEAERDAFLAKAEDLMTKHAVERWQLAKTGVRKEKPVRITFTYSSNDANLPGKRQLLVAVERAAGVMTVLAPSTKTVQNAHFIGFESDCEFAQLLYTSLLVQCARACPPDVRKVKSRYTDFMLGFGAAVARKIDEARETRTESEPGTAIVLLDRRSEVEQAVEMFFPKLIRTRAAARRYDHSARQAGAAAGQRADVSGGRNNLGGRKAIG